jgi:hypothetical protein
VNDKGFMFLKSPLNSKTVTVVYEKMGWVIEDT